MFAVVQTVGAAGEDEISTVPETWIVGDIVQWPTGKCDVGKKVRTCAKPSANWTKHKCQIIDKGIGKFISMVLNIFQHSS